MRKIIIIFIEKITLYASIFLMAALLFIISFGVFMRQVFSISYVVLDGFSMILFTWFVGFSIAYTFSQNAHVSITYFFNKLTVTLQRFLYILISLFILAFLVFLMWNGWIIAMRQMRVPLPLSPFPRGYMFIPLPISCFIMCIILLNEIYEVLWRKKKLIQKY